MNKEAINFLKTRRSSKLLQMIDPAPTSEELTEILTLASRVPDHGKHHPWSFLVFDKNSQKDVALLLRQAYQEENPDSSAAKIDLEAERFLRAPLVVAVISHVRERKVPQWEQILSAGAVCYNLCLAANALGYGTNWLTEWYAYSPRFKKLMGLDEQDQFAGFIYIGTITEKNEERERPDLDKIVRYWTL